MPAVTPATLTHEWRIRPLAPTRRRPYRRYVAVCRWSDRVEMCSGPEHKSVAACRAWISREFDGGRGVPPRKVEIKEGW